MATNEGEITVSFSHRGRKVTLDPLREKILQVYCKEVESTIPCGLRNMWVSGERNGEDFDLDVGAGCGSPWLTFRYKEREYCINVKDILDELFKFASEHESPD